MSEQSTSQWYGARTIYLHKLGDEKSYEERIVLIKASSFDEAINKAEEEAHEYVSNDDKIEVLDYVDVFSLYDEEIGDKTEVYSLLRNSELNPKEYIDKFFDTGKERTQK